MAEKWEKEASGVKTPDEKARFMSELKLRPPKLQCFPANSLAAPHAPGCLLGGWKSHAEIIRSMGKKENSGLILPGAVLGDVCGEGAEFETRIVWRA